MILPKVISLIKKNNKIFLYSIKCIFSGITRFVFFNKTFSKIRLMSFVLKGDREVGTEGKMLLLGCENGTIKGFGLASRNQV